MKYTVVIVETLSRKIEVDAEFTIYHDRIVSLVNDNMNMIKQCMTTKQIAI